MEKKKLVKQALAAFLLVSSAPMAATAGSEGENVFLAGGGCGGGCGASGCEARIQPMPSSMPSSSCSASTCSASTGTNMNSTASPKYGSSNEAGAKMEQEMNRNLNNKVTTRGPTGSYGTSATLSSPSNPKPVAPSETGFNDDNSWPNQSNRRGY